MTCLQAKERGISAPLDTYLREIRGDALLSAADERSLAEAIARGDRDSRDRMIRSNLRLVVKIARGFLGRGLSLDDLIGEGNLGLIRATSEFDPRFGTRFSTYASYWIKEAIRYALINTTATIRLPAHVVGLLTRWRRAEQALTRKLGCPPTTDQIAASFPLTDSRKAMVGTALQARQLRPEGGGGNDGESWSPAKLDAPDASLEADDERRDLLRRLDRLDARGRAVLALRFGLEGGLPLTLKEVGRRMGITREWVRKIEIRAVRKLGDDATREGDGSFAR